MRLSGPGFTQNAEKWIAITLFPFPLPQKLEDHTTYPALVTAVRDLANDNVINAVMLTGVMLLQVPPSPLTVTRADADIGSKAGRHYSKPSNPVPISEMRSSDLTPPEETVPLPDEEVRRSQRSPVAGRSSTPFRELTEEEATELNGIAEEGKRRRKR